jgi:hypothetical protein
MKPVLAPKGAQAEEVQVGEGKVEAEEVQVEEGKVEAEEGSAAAGATNKEIALDTTSRDEGTLGEASFHP